MIRRQRLATEWAAGIAAEAAALFCVAAIVLCAHPATAAELAILRNGFSIRHEHRLVMGATTRLFFAADDSSFADVPTEEITSYEKDLSLPAADGPQVSVSSGDSPRKPRLFWIRLSTRPAPLIISIPTW